MALFTTATFKIDNVLLQDVTITQAQYTGSCVANSTISDNIMGKIEQALSKYVSDKPIVESEEMVRKRKANGPITRAEDIFVSLCCSRIGCKYTNNTKANISVFPAVSFIDSDIVCSCICDIYITNVVLSTNAHFSLDIVKLSYDRIELDVISNVHVNKAIKCSNCT